MKTCVYKQSNNLKREINKDEEKGKVCIAGGRNPNDQLLWFALLLPKYAIKYESITKVLKNKFNKKGAG